MKVAFFHELHFGGARRVVGEYAPYFKKDHEVKSFYTGKQREEDFDTLFGNTAFYQFDPVAYTGKNWKAKLAKDFIEPFRLYTLHKRIAADIDKEHFDFVFVHLSQFTHAPFLLRFLKTPSVYFCHEPLRLAHDPAISLPNTSRGKKYYEMLIRKLKVFIDAQNSKKATVILANSDYTKKNIKKAYGVDAHICYLGVDPTLFKPLTIKKTYDLLFIGDSVPIEGYDTLQEIEKLFDNKVKIHVVKKEKGKYITDTELVKEYNKTKVVTMLGRFDPFSMIPNEAMACGVCPVVVNEGGPVEAVEDKKTGFIVDRNPRKMYSVIKKLLVDKTLRDKIGKQGRDSVLSYWNWQRSYERLMTIVKETHLIHAKK